MYAIRSYYEDCLALEEACPGRGLLDALLQHQLERLRGGRDRRAGKEGGDGRELASRKVMPPLESGDRLQQLHRVEVEDRARLGVVAEARVVTREEQQVFDPQRRGAEQVGLQRQAVAVAAGQLQDRFV